MLTHVDTCARMLTHAHTCSHMLTDDPTHPPARRGPAGQHAHMTWHMVTRLHTASRVLTHAHTSARMITPVSKCSHMCTHAFTCSHVLHMHARFPFPAPTGFMLGSIFRWRYSGFHTCSYTKNAQRHTHAKNSNTIQQKLESRSLHVSAHGPRWASTPPKRPQGCLQAALQK